VIKVIIYLRRQLLLALVLLSLTFIVSCAQYETWKAELIPSASHVNYKNNAALTPTEASNHPTHDSKDSFENSSTPSTHQTPTPSPSILGSDYDPAMDIHAGPVALPLEIQIPILDVEATILAVGLTKDNNMDAPKGAYGDPNWSSTFWYRGSAIPGEPGTATIAGHVNGLLGEPETFARIRRLKPGDLIIIKDKNSDNALYFVVDEVKKYSMAELSEPAVADRIFGGSVGSDGQTRLTDGKSHLTLITCTGYYKDGEFDHRTIVFSTLR
jgi:sortase (surface protein transpeptidase)